MIVHPTAGGDRVGRGVEFLLESACGTLGMDVGFLSQFAGSDRVLRHVVGPGSAGVFHAGEVRAAGSGYCSLLADGRLPALLPDTASHPVAAAIAETRTIPIGAHVGALVRGPSGEVLGTVCFLSHRPRPDMGQGHLMVAETCARLVERASLDAAGLDARRAADENALDEAIAAGDPRMVYQPIVDLADMSMHKVEALARFGSRPELTPDRWFAMAHSLNRGQLLEIVAVRNALAECGTLPQDLVVGVNVSPRTLMTTDLRPQLEGFDPSRLILELTEHEPIADYGPLVSALGPLREMGVRVAIDDAGAGYSSLGHVLRLKPDFIKLDRSFTQGIDVDRSKRSLVSSLCLFARDTGVVTVAEGVETEAEADALRSAGVDRGQGHLFGRPVAIERLREILSVPLSP